MTSPAALEWLTRRLRAGPPALPAETPPRGLDRQWHGPVVIRPMIQLRPALDRCAPMRVTYADYDDPERWWL